MPTSKKRNLLIKARKRRVRGKMSGTTERPRLSVFRSNKFTYAQVIDDSIGKVVAVANEHRLAKKTKKILSGTKLERAQAVGQSIADQLKSKQVKKLCFDRGSYQFHGRVQAVADVVRAAGIEV
jgi:large subunit ribosomal protein L18